MNESMEAELTEIDSIIDNLAVTVEVNVDEAIPIDIIKDQSTEAYKETKKKDIDNIDTYDTRTKANTTKWSPIYEVIDEAYIKGSKIFSDGLVKECKDISNKACDIPRDVKKYIKRMAIEQGLYTQVIILRRDYLTFVATDKNKNEAKFKFQG